MPILQGTLIGGTPLLMHNPASMRRDTGTIGRKVIPTPEEEAEASAYRLPNNDLCVPAVAVRNSILAGCVGLRLGRRAASPVVAGALLPSDLMFPLYTPDGDPIKEYVIDTQRAVVQRQGIMRSRARLDPVWIVAFSFNLNTELASGEVIERIVFEATGVAGSSVGLLDYRPQKKAGTAPTNWVSCELWISTAGRGRARHGRAWRGAAWHGEARIVLILNLGVAWWGEAGWGLARPGWVGRGWARRGEDCTYLIDQRGKAWRGEARRGVVRRGRVL